LAHRENRLFPFVLFAFFRGKKRPSRLNSAAKQALARDALS